VVLENVASLLSPHRRHAFDSVCATLLEMFQGYTWYVGVLCPGDNGGAARRAHVYWVGVRS
jgi:site-specific DNA-cytosine methylase